MALPPKVTRRTFLMLSFLLAGALPDLPVVEAQAQAGRVGRVTGLDLPRFVSLKASKARLRVGPGVQYPVKWEYLAPDIPLEVIAEFGNWRMVRDWTGAEGWMYHTLLTGRRTAVVSPWRSGVTSLRRFPSGHAPISASLESGVFVEVEDCNGTWCQVQINGAELEGYIQQIALWGVYPGEVVR